MAQTRAGIARQVAYVPQAHAPPFPFEALEVVLVGRTARLGLFGQPGRHDRACARKALDQLAGSGTSRTATMRAFRAARGSLY